MTGYGKDKSEEWDNCPTCGRSKVECNKSDCERHYHKIEVRG